MVPIWAFEQHFAGINNGQVSYRNKDVTQKHIEVLVKIWDTRDADRVKIAHMDVFLGNIGITEQ